MERFLTSQVEVKTADQTNVPFTYPYLPRHGKLGPVVIVETPEAEMEIRMMDPYGSVRIVRAY